MKTLATTATATAGGNATPPIKNSNTIINVSSTTDNNNSSITIDSNNIETNYFEEESDSPVGVGDAVPQFQTPTGNSTKRPLSLDLNINKNPVKKLRMDTSSGASTSLALESPDLQGIKMTTPDLEKLLLPGSLLQTPTPGIVFPTKVTSEQEDYAKGFVDALNNLLNSENTHSNGMSGGSFTYTNLESSFPVAIKDEPQNGLTSPPVSPIDMETQEKIKLERKRQRNRVAASKCRKRKLERISKLEDKVKILKGENVDLASVVKNLKEHVFQLKQQVIEHIGSGCNISAQNCGTILHGK